MKIALLSNINMNHVIRLLKKEIDVYDVEGYGNEIGTLMNPASSIYEFAPGIIFLVVDLMELLAHEIEMDIAKFRIIQWFADLKEIINPSVIYYISDAYLWGAEIAVIIDKGLKHRIETVWQIELEKLIKQFSNVRIFSYRSCIEKLGENAAFSLKMWYMGKIIHSSTMQQQICKEIKNRIMIETYTPKKVLLLDLDNTLWGGLAGEDDLTPITLSEDHSGLAYKNLQRVIIQMKKQGVILGIVSKNNEEDALKIINTHPHMILTGADFTVKKINWHRKTENIKELAEVLNLGLDSFVFFDDNPTERQIVKEFLPDVVVPDFPDKPEKLAITMAEIWKSYFDRVSLTKEDIEKTAQYTANIKRDELKSCIHDFDEYLQNLNIVLIRKNENEFLKRITQIINKTNQFNLTTIRHSQSEIQDMLNDPQKKIFVYQATDKFGDNGIISVVIVDTSVGVPVIKEFVMSCRIMGKNIENAIIDDVEEFFIGQGYKTIYAEYAETTKNKPVAEFYEKLGYFKVENVNGYIRYAMNVSERSKRDYKLKKCSEE